MPRNSSTTAETFHKLAEPLFLAGKSAFSMSEVPLPPGKNAPLTDDLPRTGDFRTNQL